MKDASNHEDFVRVTLSLFHEGINGGFTPT
jgi:hypothetical protein